MLEKMVLFNFVCEANGCIWFFMEICENTSGGTKTNLEKSSFCSDVAISVFRPKPSVLFKLETERKDFCILSDTSTHCTHSHQVRQCFLSHLHRMRQQISSLWELVCWILLPLSSTNSISVQFSSNFEIDTNFILISVCCLRLKLVMYFDLFEQ